MNEGKDAFLKSRKPKLYLKIAHQSETESKKKERLVKKFEASRMSNKVIDSSVE